MSDAHVVAFKRRNGSGPWPCRVCGEPVLELIVHHVNGDHSDNHPDNLVAVHHACHQAIHADYERLAAASAKRWQDPEQHTRQSALIKRLWKDGRMGSSSWRQSASDKAHQQWKAGNIGKPRLVAQTCSYCRKTFQPKRATQMFCSKSCAGRYYA